jgi:hypothetical protein
MDTVSCSEVFVLHSEAALQVRESPRVGSGVSPDESVLLRDYLRLFANVVPKELVESKVGKLIELAKERIWVDPEGALKQVEELAESFGHPETYRALLRFYEVRNATGESVLKRAQRLWELTRDSHDALLWTIVRKCFDPKQRWQRREGWSPDLGFVESVWRDSGNRETRFGLLLAEAYSQEDRESRSADVLLEIIHTSAPMAEVVSRCIRFLQVSGRDAEASRLIQDFKTALVSDPGFLQAWARFALRDGSRDSVTELARAPVAEMLKEVAPYLAAQVFLQAGSVDEANDIADHALRDVAEGGLRSEYELREAGELFAQLGRFEEFEKVCGGRYPTHIFREIRERVGRRGRRR